MCASALSLPDCILQLPFLLVCIKFFVCICINSFRLPVCIRSVLVRLYLIYVCLYQYLYLPEKYPPVSIGNILACLCLPVYSICIVNTFFTGTLSAYLSLQI
jgi:hypothetical protein